MRTAILIVSYNSASDINRCISSLLQSKNHEFDLFVFENGGRSSLHLLCKYYELNTNFEFFASKQDTLCQRFAGNIFGISVNLFYCGKNLGFAAANNILIDFIHDLDRYDYCWFLNPDTRPNPDALEALLNKMLSDNYDAVGSCLISPGSQTVQLYAGRWRKYIARGFNLGRGMSYLNDKPEHWFEANMDYLSGASILAKSSILAERKFDERFFLYCEDVDWCMRRPAIKMGVCKNSIVVHEHGSSIGSSEHTARRAPLSVFLDERSKILYSRKHFPLILPLIIVLSFILCFQYLWRRSLLGFLAALRGWLAGILNEHGKPRDL